MCTVAEICSTGARVTLSDVPEVLLTATNSEPQVQDAGLAAKAGAYPTASGTPMPFPFSGSVCMRGAHANRPSCPFCVDYDPCNTGS
ncbi:conserved hypothetical protein [Burkholderia diffusa]|nr:conserved hypothetical protein [Burkholderia diffusa]